MPINNHSCGFEMAVPIAVRAPEALAIGGKRRADVEPLLVPLCVLLQCFRGEETGIYFVDSTKLAVCHNKRIKRNKVFKGLAKRGRSTMGWFFGFKLHMVINNKGEVMAVKITAGNTDDRKPFDTMTAALEGRIVGDKGYIVNQHSTVTHYQRPNMTHPQEGGTGGEVSEILFFSAKSKRRPSLIYSMQIIPVCLSIVARRKGVSATRRGGLNWTPISLLVGHPCKLFHREIYAIRNSSAVRFALRMSNWSSSPGTMFRRFWSGLSTCILRSLWVSVFLRNLCLPENAEAIDNARYSMIIEVEAHTRMTFLASILHNLGASG